jgi:hypothetical protein
MTIFQKLFAHLIWPPSRVFVKTADTENTVKQKMFVHVFDPFIKPEANRGEVKKINNCKRKKKCCLW